MKFLVDADVLSEPTKPRPANQVIDWLRFHEADLVISPVVLGELEYGILLLPAGRKRTRLLHWFSQGAQQLKVVEFDGATAHVWAKLLADLKRKGRAMPIKDSLIAATALQHSLTVVTRNTSDYRNAGVGVVNPFKSK